MRTWYRDRDLSALSSLAKILGSPTKPTYWYSYRTGSQEELNLTGSCCGSIHVVDGWLYLSAGTCDLVRVRVEVVDQSATVRNSRVRGKSAVG